MEKGEDPDQVFRTILAGTREHTRVLLPWNETLPEYHAGLCQEANEEIQKVYQKLIRMRHQDETFVYGDFVVLNQKKDRFVYRRRLDGSEYIIDCNLGRKQQKAFEPGNGYKLLFATRAGVAAKLAAYEARIWKKI